MSLAPPSLIKSYKPSLLRTAGETMIISISGRYSGLISYSSAGSLCHVTDKEGIALYGVANYYEVSSGFTIGIYFFGIKDTTAYYQRDINMAAHFTYHFF